MEAKQTDKGSIECPRCGQRDWCLVFKDAKVLEDNGKGTQKCTGLLVAIRCGRCNMEARRDKEGQLVWK